MQLIVWSNGFVQCSLTDSISMLIISFILTTNNERELWGDGKKGGVYNHNSKKTILMESDKLE